MTDDNNNEPTIEQLKEKLAAAEKDAEKWKALSRKNEERATENADKASKYDTLLNEQQSSKSETEKLAERLEKAEKTLAERDAKEATTRLLADVAKEKGLDARKISTDLLRGNTREELEAHADALLAAFPETPAGPSADGQGNNGKPISEGEMSADDIINAVAGK